MKLNKVDFYILNIPEVGHVSRFCLFFVCIIPLLESPGSFGNEWNVMSNMDESVVRGLRDEWSRQPSLAVLRAEPPIIQTAWTSFISGIWG